MKTNPERDPMDTFIAWTIAGSLTLLAACISVLSPLTYVWLMGIAGMAGTLGLTLTIAGAMCSDGGIGFLFAGDVVKFGFEVIGAILTGLGDCTK